MTIHEIIDLQRRSFAQEHSDALLTPDSKAAFHTDFRQRRDLLIRLQQTILEREQEIQQALYADLAKSPTESYMTETGVVLAEISYVLKHLKKWMRPQRVRASLSTFPGRNRIYPEPYGLTLIFSPWN